MNKVISLTMVFLLLSFTAFAQDEEPFSLQIITADNVAQLEEIAHWEHFEDSAVAATFSSDGKWLAVALGDGKVQILDATTFSPIDILEGAEADGYMLLFNNDNSRLALTDRQGMVLLWDVDSGERITFFQPHRMFSEISKNLSTFIIHDAFENTVTSYNAETTELYTTIAYNGNPRPTISPDGALILTGDLNNNIQVWNAQSGELITILETTLETPNQITATLNSFGFTPEDNIWATWQAYLPGEEIDSQSIIQVWEKDTYQSLFSLNGRHIYWRVYFDASPQYIIAAGEDAFTTSGNIWLWNMNDRIETELIGVPGGMIASINPRNDLILIGSGTSPFVIVQAANELIPLIRLEAPSTQIPVQFSNDDKMILTIGQDVIVWGVRSNQ